MLVGFFVSVLMNMASIGLVGHWLSWLILGNLNSLFSSSYRKTICLILISFVCFLEKLKSWVSRSDENISLRNPKERKEEEKSKHNFRIINRLFEIVRRAHTHTHIQKTQRDVLQFFYSFFFLRLVCPSIGLPSRIFARNSIFIHFILKPLFRS